MTAHISWDYYTLIKVPHIVLDCYMPITDIYAAIRYSKTQDDKSWKASGMISGKLLIISTWTESGVASIISISLVAKI